MAVVGMCGALALFCCVFVITHDQQYVTNLYLPNLPYSNPVYRQMIDFNAGDSGWVGVSIRVKHIAESSSSVPPHELNFDGCPSSADTSGGSSVRCEAASVFTNQTRLKTLADAFTQHPGTAVAAYGVCVFAIALSYAAIMVVMLSAALVFRFCLGFTFFFILLGHAELRYGTCYVTAIVMFTCLLSFHHSLFQVATPWYGNARLYKWVIVLASVLYLGWMIASFTSNNSLEYVRFEHVCISVIAVLQLFVSQMLITISPVEIATRVAVAVSPLSTIPDLGSTPRLDDAEQEAQEDDKCLEMQPSK